MACPEAARARQVSALERRNPGQHVVTESLSGAYIDYLHNESNVCGR